MLVGCAGLVVAASACQGGSPFAAATPQGEDGPRLVHERLGFSIAAPPWVGREDWQRVDLDGAELAFRDGAGTSISLAASCPHSRASAGALARHITVGTARSELLAAGPTETGGLPGWSQTFDSDEVGRRVRVKAVTVAGRGCVVDWLLVGADTARFAAIEPEFDAWVESFRAGALAESPVPAPEPEPEPEAEVRPEPAVAEP